MKRLLILTLATIMCVAPFILPVAAEINDSLHLSSEEESRLDLSPGDTVITLFGNNFMKAFSDQEDIVTMVERSVERSTITYMIVPMLGEAIYKKPYKGEITKLNPATGISDWSDFYTYAVSPNKVFGSSVKVNKVYCLDGDRSCDGVYIYYDTDIGEYVLFKEFLSYDEAYLFPLSDFYEFAKAVYDERLLYKDMDGGGGAPIEELFDVENYLFKPKSTFNGIPIGLTIGAVIIVGGVLCLSYHRKVKKSKKADI